MKLLEIRDTIYSLCCIIKDNKQKFILTHANHLPEDNCEVVGIRSRVNNGESYIELILK